MKWKTRVFLICFNTFNKFIIQGVSMILLELSENNIIAFDLLVYDEDNINHREYISSFVRFKNELNVD